MNKQNSKILIFLLIGLVLAFIASKYPNTSIFYQVVSILPLITILALLFLRVNMIVAALAGGVMAMILAKISLDSANHKLLETIPKMLSMTVPIINSAVAAAVFKAGGYTAALTLVRRKIGTRIEFVGAFIVVLQAAATYMSGVGGGSAMVIAPLAFAAVGAIPPVIAGMSIAAAVSFTTSPASLESSIVAKFANIDILHYVETMRPYWLIFCAIAIIIAFVGTKRSKTLFTGEEPEELKSLNNRALWKLTMPALFLLFSVVMGPQINKLVGSPILGPLMYTLGTVFLIFLCSKLNLSESVDALIDGSQYILTRLLGVGIFLTFIFLIQDTGTFKTIANVISNVDPKFTVPVAIIAGFLIGVPAGAYVGSILALILPVTIALGFSPLHIGFVTMAVGLGSQLSFVNITMQALSYGFQIPVSQVSKGNVPFIMSCMLLLLVISVVV